MNEADFKHIAQVGNLFEPTRILFLVVGFVALTQVVRFISAASKSLENKYSAQRLLFSQISTSLNFIAYVFGGIFLIYGVLQPPRELMFALGGSAAVAFGLSMKDLVASVVAGLILLFDKPFQVGDRVTFAGVYGEIVSIGLRAVRLVTLDDNLVTIPNNRFITDVVASGNAGALDMMVVIDLHIAHNADVKLANELLFYTMVTSRFVYLKKPVAIVISEVRFSNQIAVQLKAKAYVLDVKFEKAFFTDVYVRANEAFNQHGILRPQVSIRHGDDLGEEVAKV